MMLSLLILASLCSVYRADQEVEGELQLELEHSFDSGASWAGRGVITVTSTRTGAASQDQPGLSPEQKADLAGLCEAGGLYLLRAKVQQGGHTLPTLSSFTSACSLVRSGMVDSITLNMDWRGRLVSISLAGHGNTASPGIRDSFRTKIILNGGTASALRQLSYYMNFLLRDGGRTCS